MTATHAPSRPSALVRKARETARTTVTFQAIIQDITTHQQRLGFEYAIKTELPDHAAQILESNDVHRRAAALAQLIATEYFPINEIYFSPEDLDDSPNEWYRIILQATPCYPYGFTFDDLHELTASASNGYVLAALLIPPSELDPGIREAWLDEVRPLITEPTAERLWQPRWTLADLQSRLRDSRYQDVSQIVEHIFNLRDNPFLTSMEDLDGAYHSRNLWTAAELHRLSQLWVQAARVLEQAAQGSRLIEAQPDLVMNEVMDLLENSPTGPKRKRKRKRKTQ